MKQQTESMLILFFVFFLPDLISACATCYGAPEAPATEGMNWAIITLLGVTGGVLGGIIKSVITISNRTRNFQRKNKI
ncbi:MAG: hypothetical protein CMG74_01945 [Candidatus Marinimicrobia bacterium]|nr:hypothetical protein [Candidatus Neomarinimicrobiota bacterium]|tara:strand:- start:312 stop:545 length:234 start_codon:yes stop_codon:yes gene_type:complete